MKGLEGCQHEVFFVEMELKSAAFPGNKKKLKYPTARCVSSFSIARIYGTVNED